MATYKGILITETITAEDGLTTESDNALLLLSSVSVKQKDTLNNYTISYNYDIYKNSDMEGEPINYSFGLTTSTTCTGSSHVTNLCYTQIGDYLTSQGVSYSYVTV